MNNRLHYQELLVISFFILLTFIAMYPAMLNPHNIIYGPLYGTDNRGTIWRFWWMKYSYAHHLPYTFNSMIAYPFGVTSADGVNPYIYTSFFKLLTVLTNEIFAYNFGLFVSFILSAVFTYCIVYKLSKNKIAGLISGLIFAFSPYHFNKAWEHFTLAQTQWIPLYVLTLLYLRDIPSFKTALFSAVAFTLVMSFDFYYAYIMSVFTLGFVIFVLFYRWRDKFKTVNSDLLNSSFRIIGSLFVTMLLILLINFPLLYPIFKTAFFGSKSGAAIADTYIRSFGYLFSQSARPLSYFLPAVANPVLGKFTKPFLGSIFYGRNTIEHTLYLGWVPLVLAFVAYRVWKNRRKQSKFEIRNSKFDNEDFTIGFFIFSGWLAFLFSMPPYLNLGLFKIYFPSYFMYKLLPMFRAYARFGILVMLSVSVLAGFGLRYILQRITTFRKRFAFATLVMCLILFEFTNIPPFRTTDVSKTPVVYQWLAKQPGDFAIAEYPMGEAGLGEAFMPYDYLFWQRVHQKKLINGAPIGTYAYKIKQKINKITVPETPAILSWLGAKYVIVHLDAYRRGADRTATAVIGEEINLRSKPGFKFIEKFEDVEIYEVVAQPIKPDIKEIEIAR